MIWSQIYETHRQGRRSTRNTKKKVYTNHKGRWGLENKESLRFRASSEKISRNLHLLLFREKKDGSHTAEDDKGGQDVELVERVVLLDVGLLPRLVSEPKEQRVNLLGVKPLAGKVQKSSLHWHLRMPK